MSNQPPQPDATGSLHQAAVTCAARTAARWSDDLLEVARRVDWPSSGDFTRLGAAMLVALDAEHDRRQFGTDASPAWAQVVDAVWELPAPALRIQVEWANTPGYSTDDPPGLWNALACVATAARILDQDDACILAELEASLATTNQEVPHGRI